MHVHVHVHVHVHAQMWIFFNLEDIYIKIINSFRKRVREWIRKKSGSHRSHVGTIVGFVIVLIHV